MRTTDLLFPREPKVLSDQLILELLDSRELKVDLETAEVRLLRKLIEPILVGKSDKRFKIKLAWHGNERIISRSRLVYMAGCGHVIPFGFEIHHIDGDRYNDAWSNLAMLSTADHLKVHKWQGIATA